MKQLLVIVLSLVAFAGAAATNPNFLLIFTDDQGYGDVSTYGASDVRTPNIDRLDAEGMLFTTMRANCTVCSPSRAALLTYGTHPKSVIPELTKIADYFEKEEKDFPTELMRMKAKCVRKTIREIGASKESPQLTRLK